MVNQAKIDTIEKMREGFNRAKVVIIADFRGLNVQKMTELRKQFREVAVDYCVVKNTLARRAAQGTRFEKLVELLKGPTSLALCEQNEVAPAKVLSTFTKKEKVLRVKGGVLGGQVLEASDVEILAELPPKEVLLGQLVSGFQAPLNQFAGVLQGVLRDFLWVLKAIEEKKG